MIILINTSLIRRMVVIVALLSLASAWIVHAGDVAEKKIPQVTDLVTNQVQKFIGSLVYNGHNINKRDQVFYLKLLDEEKCFTWFTVDLTNAFWIQPRHLKVYDPGLSVKIGFKPVWYLIRVIGDNGNMDAISKLQDIVEKNTGKTSLLAAEAIWLISRVSVEYSPQIGKKVLYQPQFHDGFVVLTTIEEPLIYIGERKNYDEEKYICPPGKIDEKDSYLKGTIVFPKSKP